MKKIPPGPWSLSWQTSPTGKRTRFVVKDAKGKIIAKALNEAAAGVVARAAEMESLLIAVTETAAVWRIILSSEFGHDVTEPGRDAAGCIDRARELLGEIRRSRY